MLTIQSTAVWLKDQGGSRATLCGADAHPRARNCRALPAKVLVIQAGFASEGGWTRLTPIAGRALSHQVVTDATYVEQTKWLKS